MKKLFERSSAWLDERTGHRRLLRSLLDEPIVGGARWAYVFGSTLTLTFSIQALSGFLLMSAYSPGSQTAWASVHFIEHRMSGGFVVRGLHHFGSQAMVVLLALHVFQVATFGAYKRPREVNFLLGLGLMAITLGFALTGYLLPWDQKGYWATQVATNILGTMPFVGRPLQTLVQGGPEYGNLTLTRFYSLHVALLPFLLMVLLALHLALFRKHGVTPPASADRKKSDAFYPRQVGKDLAAALAVLLLLFVFTLRHHGAPLDAPADPSSDYPARPEWYFLSLFQLLKYLPGKLEVLGTLGIPLVGGIYLVALPFVDRGESTALRGRWRWLAPLYVAMVAMALLTWLSERADASDPKFRAERAIADERATVANRIAMDGVPPEGPLAMTKNDPALRGQELFVRHCAACHVLGSVGDPEKAKAPVLDGWGTEPFVLAMLHDPDGDARFGRTPYAGEMPSMDVAPDDPGAASAFKPMSAPDMLAAAAFLASQGDEPDEATPRDAPRANADRVKAGEVIVKERCTACHLLDGRGDDTGQETAPELKGYGGLAWTVAQIRDPSSPSTYRSKALDPDRKGHMPKFAEELTDADVVTLARWVRIRARRAPIAPSR